MSAPAADAPHGVSVVEPTKASPENQEKANKLKEQGMSAFVDGDHGSAVTAFTEALTFDPNNVVLLSYRSAAYAAIGKDDPENYRLAEADGATCIGLKPEWSKGYLRQATALFYQKKYKEAVLAYASGLTRDPSSRLLSDGLASAHKHLAESATGHLHAPVVPGPLGAFQFVSRRPELGGLALSGAGLPATVDAWRQRVADTSQVDAAGLLLFHPATDLALTSDAEVADFIASCRTHHIMHPLLTLMSRGDVNKHLAASEAAGRYSPAGTRSNTRNSNSPLKPASDGSSAGEGAGAAHVSKRVFAGSSVSFDERKSADGAPVPGNASLGSPDAFLAWMLSVPRSEASGSEASGSEFGSDSSDSTIAEWAITEVITLLDRADSLQKREREILEAQHKLIPDILRMVQRCLDPQMRASRGPRYTRTLLLHLLDRAEFADVREHFSNVLNPHTDPLPGSLAPLWLRRH